MKYKTRSSSKVVRCMAANRIVFFFLRPKPSTTTSYFCRERSGKECFQGRVRLKYFFRAFIRRTSYTDMTTTHYDVMAFFLSFTKRPRNNISNFEQNDKAMDFTLTRVSYLCVCRPVFLNIFDKWKRF